MFTTFFSSISLNFHNVERKKKKCGFFSNEKYFSPPNKSFRKVTQSISRRGSLREYERKREKKLRTGSGSWKSAGSGEINLADGIKCRVVARGIEWIKYVTRTWPAGAKTKRAMRRWLDPLHFFTRGCIFLFPAFSRASASLLICEKFSFHFGENSDTAGGMDRGVGRRVCSLYATLSGEFNLVFED